jgi:hypothetical protein
MLCVSIVGINFLNNWNQMLPFSLSCLTNATISVSFNNRESLSPVLRSDSQILDLKSPSVTTHSILIVQIYSYVFFK